MVIYDGECKFCISWVQRWRLKADNKVDFLPSQDRQVSSQFPELPTTCFDRAVQLVETDGRVYSGAEAIFRLLAGMSTNGWLLWLYQNAPGAATLSEIGYRFVGRHRRLFGIFTRFIYRNGVPSAGNHHQRQS